MSSDSSSEDDDDEVAGSETRSSAEEEPDRSSTSSSDDDGNGNESDASLTDASSISVASGSDDPSDYESIREGSSNPPTSPEQSSGEDLFNGGVDDDDGRPLDGNDDSSSEEDMSESRLAPSIAGSAGVRFRAEVSIDVKGGKIQYYDRGEKRYGVAVCAHHANCKIERTFRPGRRESQGRPVGLFLAFLDDGENHGRRKRHKRNANYIHAIRHRLRQGFVAAAEADYEKRFLLMSEAGAVMGLDREPEWQP